MGVADNRTYKNEYLFNNKHNSAYGNPGDTAKDNPSIEVDPKVNSTIKENPYRSNVEIEGREVVLQPDLSALFNAKGKRHSQGGMDVLLKPNAFIFSDFEGLKLSPKDHELFELKEGGKNSTDTPADVLKRNIDLNHYNSLVTILGDPFKDDLAKKSSARMLEKYIATLGNIAYIQETKKGMPQGVPDFAQGSAPVYNPDLKNELMENKQYAKAGGTVDNPYLPKAQMGMWNAMVMQKAKQNQKKANGQVPTAPDTNTPPNWGLWPGDKLPIFQNRYHTTNAADKIPDLNALSTQLGYTGPKNNLAFQHWLYNSSPENKAIIDKWHGTYNVGPTNGMFDGKIGIRWANALNEITTPPPANPPANTPPGVTTPPPAAPPVPGPTPGDVTGNAQGVKTADWKFTPWQRLSHGVDWMNFLNVDKYGANREHYTATYTNPFLTNPEQTIGDTKALANQQIRGANILNPILRNAQGAQAYGQELDRIPGIRTQYDNQNVGIKNQFAQYNNQVKNNESLVNAQNDINYSRDATTAEVNYKNMKDHLKNIALSDTMSDAALNQGLAYKLLTQQNPAYGFDWNTGNFNRNNKSILDANTGDAKSDMYTELAQSIMSKIRRGQNPTPEEVNFMKSLAVGKLNFSTGTDNTPFKKGGKVKNPYK